MRPTPCGTKRRSPTTGRASSPISTASSPRSSARPLISTTRATLMTSGSTNTSAAWTLAAFDRFFGQVRETVVPLVQAIGERGEQPEAPFLTAHVNDATQRALSFDLMRLVGLNDADTCLAFTEHPLLRGLLGGRRPRGDPHLRGQPDVQRLLDHPRGGSRRIRAGCRSRLRAHVPRGWHLHGHPRKPEAASSRTPPAAAARS